MSASAPAQAAAERSARLAEELRNSDVDLLLVDSPINLRYLTGFTGTSGLALIAADPSDGSKAARQRFLTDFRYATQSSEQVPDSFEREIVAGELLAAAAKALPAPGGRLGFDDASLTVARHRKLSELLPEGWELVAVTGAVERLRAVKEAGEISLIRTACELADEALLGVLGAGVVGRTEREVAVELELRMRRLGAEASSFPPIVAAGAQAALPHATPRDQEIPANVLLTIDWGALSDGYCSDCTRTYATGEGIPAEAREIYSLVLRAQEAGLAAVTAGPNGREVDAAARAVIEQAGQGEHFGHGLGHGVGMEIHEAPRLSRTAGEDPLVAGNVVTVEPGVYLSGDLGVRIEDLVVVQQTGCEILTNLPKSLTVID